MLALSQVKLLSILPSRPPSYIRTSPLQPDKIPSVVITIGQHLSTDYFQWPLTCRAFELVRASPHFC